jgi:hypothetical protein
VSASHQPIAERGHRPVPEPLTGVFFHRSNDVFRVCPKSLSRITELSQHEPDGGKSKESQCIAVEILKIFGKAPAAIEPGNCALDYPTFWEDHEPFGMIRGLTISVLR